MIGKWLKILFTILLVSMFFFPFEFKAFLGQNTKNLMAALGLVFIFMTFVLKGNLIIPRELIVLLFLSGIVSLVSFVAVVYNQTPDYSYVTYIRAAVIWLSAAYVASMVIWMVHGYIDVKLVVNYIVAVCVFQCVMAMVMEFIPAVKDFVNAYVEQGQDLLEDINRLYGIGASLDVGGSRFAVALVAIAALVDAEIKEMKVYEIVLYSIAFIIITVVGNMIARTTIIGVLLAFVYIVVKFLGNFLKGGSGYGKLLGAIVMVLLVMVPVAVTLYNTFPEVKDLMRFGFEGFFSYFEEGEFETTSTNKLQTMVVFPEDMKTWIIGDGYFENSRNDVNYLGDATTQGFYMGTDIGYLRFIFYGGIFLVIAMSAVIIYAGVICMHKYPDYKYIFILAILVNMIVWLKVATDIFLFFCLFITAFVIHETLDDPEEDEEDEEDEDWEWDDEDEDEDEDEEDEQPETVENPEKIPVAEL